MKMIKFKKKIKYIRIKIYKHILDLIPKLELKDKKTNSKLLRFKIEKYKNK